MQHHYSGVAPCKLASLQVTCCCHACCGTCRPLPYCAVLCCAEEAHKNWTGPAHGHTSWGLVFIGGSAGQRQCSALSRAAEGSTCTARGRSRRSCPRRGSWSHSWLLHLSQHSTHHAGESPPTQCWRCFAPGSSCFWQIMTGQVCRRIDRAPPLSVGCWPGAHAACFFCSGFP